MSNNTEMTSSTELLREKSVPSCPQPVAHSVRRWLLFSAMALFVIVSGICSLFTLATFDKIYAQARIDQYVLAAEPIRDALEAKLCSQTGSRVAQTACSVTDSHNDNAGIERILNNGASALGRLLREHRSSNPAFSAANGEMAVSLISPERVVVQSSSPSLANQPAPSLHGDKTAGGAATFAKKNGRYVVELPLTEPDGGEFANLALSFMDTQDGSHLDLLMDQHKTVLLLVLLGGAALLTLSIGITIPAGLPKGQLPIKRFTTISVTLVCAAQVLASLGGAYIFKQNFKELAWERTQVQAQSLLTHLHAKLAANKDPDALLESLPAGAPAQATTDSNASIEDQIFTVRMLYSGREYHIRYVNGEMTLAPPSHQPHHAGSYSEDSGNSLLFEIRNGSRLLGYVATRYHEQQISKILTRIGIEALMIVVISMLCLVELMLLVFKYLERRVDKSVGISKVRYGVMRPTIFLFLFGIDLSAALIPLQMERIYVPIMNLPKDVVLSLPVSAMFMMVGVTFLIAGAWMDRRGWHEPFVIGVVITGISKFYAWLAPDAFQFIIAMSGIGFGYGLALMAAQGFVMANTTDRDKAHGIAYFFAGVYAGSIGGTAIGAMLAERIGYDLVFFIGSMFIFVSLAYGLLLMRCSFQAPDIENQEHRTKASGNWGFVTFLMDRNVWTLVIFCSIPSAVAVIGFLNYFSPVYLTRLGVSESIIGGVLTLYGLSMVYVSPLIGKRIDSTERKDMFIFAGCALGGCAFLSFYVLTGLTATIFAILFLGLSMSCLQSSQTTYTLKLQATKRYGDGKAVAMVRASSRIGQMLGPMVFSWLMVADDTEMAVVQLGFAYLIIAFLFLALRKPEHVAPVPVPEQPPQEVAETGNASG